MEMDIALNIITGRGELFLHFPWNKRFLHTSETITYFSEFIVMTEADAVFMGQRRSHVLHQVIQFL